MKTFIAIIVGTALVSLGRFLVPGHALTWAGSYEALAHIWVGVLVAVGLTPTPDGTDAFTAYDLFRNRVAAWSCLTAATVLETVMFLTRSQ